MIISGLLYFVMASFQLYFVRRVLRPFCGVLGLGVVGTQILRVVPSAWTGYMAGLVRSFSFRLVVGRGYGTFGRVGAGRRSFFVWQWLVLSVVISRQSCPGPRSIVSAIRGESLLSVGVLGGVAVTGGFQGVPCWLEGREEGNDMVLVVGAGTMRGGGPRQCLRAVEISFFRGGDVFTGGVACSVEP